MLQMVAYEVHQYWEQPALNKNAAVCFSLLRWGNVVSSRHDASRRLGVELPWKEKDRSSYKLALGADSWTHLWTFQQKVSPPRKIVK